MSDNNPSERLGRRSFLNRMAIAAGAAQLSPRLLAAAAPAAVVVASKKDSVRREELFSPECRIAARQLS